jgi:hypothetical protein
VILFDYYCLSHSAHSCSVLYVLPLFTRLCRFAWWIVWCVNKKMLQKWCVYIVSVYIVFILLFILFNCLSSFEVLDMFLERGRRGRSLFPCSFGVPYEVDRKMSLVRVENCFNTWWWPFGPKHIVIKVKHVHIPIKSCVDGICIDILYILHIHTTGCRQ